MKLFITALVLSSSMAMAADPMAGKSTQLDDLVRGELSAMKAYDAALGDMKDGKEKTALMAIRKDHDRATTILSKYVAGKKSVLEDTESAGPWGTFAKTWTKGAALMGNKTALSALTQGEEHGINEYKEALEDKTIPADLKATIKAELLPAQQKHISTLKTFM